MEVSGQLHAPISSFPGEEPRHPCTKRLSGPQSQPGNFGQKDFLPLPGIKPFIVQPIAKLLFRLHYLGELG